MRLEWKPQDCWIGVSWKHEQGDHLYKVDVWVCLLPMLPLHLWWIHH